MNTQHGESATGIDPTNALSVDTSSLMDPTNALSVETSSLTLHGVRNISSDPNLIDLDTPPDACPSYNDPRVPSTGAKVPLSGIQVNTSVQDINLQNDHNLKTSSNYVNSDCKYIGKVEVENNLNRSETGNTGIEDKTWMNVSHTESGYLTDSVSCMSHDQAHNSSHERHPSFGSSENDKTPCVETIQGFSSSENETTPCRDSAISYPDFGEEGSVVNPRHKLCKSKSLGNQTIITDLTLTNAMHGFTEFDENSYVNQIGKLDQNNLNCDTGTAIRSTWATEDATRPHSLTFPQVEDTFHTRSQSDYNAFSGAGAVCQQDKSDIRKRSKSSGFPIPKVKAGVIPIDDSLSRSLPHGKVVRKDTGLIEFIADDLQEKIRRSSPMSKTASSDVSSRRSSLMSLTSVDSSMSSTMATSMTSGMSRSFPQSPDCIPPIDPMAIHEIENQARLVADSLDHMMNSLKNNLHKMSAISVGCEEAYKTSVDVTCDSVDASIKCMYALMAKCEELSVTMEPVYKLAHQIKEIKRLLDRFESQLGDKQ